MNFETYHINDSIYSHRELLDHAKESKLSVSVPEWEQQIFGFIHAFLLGELPIVQQTSGTTGVPVPFSLNRDSMIKSANRTLEHFELQQGDRTLHCLPMHYVAGKMMVVRALVGGLNLLMVEPSSRPLRQIQSGIQFAAMVPLQVFESLQNRDNLELVDKLLIGGGEIYQELKTELSALENTVCFESFAMTETYTHFAVRQINGAEADPDFQLMKDVVISLDKRGCLVVDLPGVIDEPVITNDLVNIDSAGRRFSWLGRIDNVINSGGIKIIPEILEKRIRKLLGFNCLILSQRDDRLGEQIVLVVETDLPSPPVEEWKETLLANLEKYLVPKQILTVTEIPRNASFKPDRNATRKIIHR